MLKAIVNGAEKDIVRIPMIGDGPATVTGIDSVTFETDATSVIDYTIKGNLQQSGTPSSSSPIYPSECGEKTGNLMPSAPAETKSLNGITVSCDGLGVYNISGTADGDASIEFTIPEFVIPVSVGSGGSGTMSLFNGRIGSVQGDSKLEYYYNNEKVDGWQLIVANRQSNNYGDVMNSKKVNKIVFVIKSGITANADVKPMFTDSGNFPQDFETGCYKLPITCGNSTRNIYLSEPIRKIGDYVDVAGLSLNGATRIIAKLILTGDEQYSAAHIDVGQISTDSIQAYRKSSPFKTCICSHYNITIDVSGWNLMNDKTIGLYSNPSFQFYRLYIRDSTFVNNAQGFVQWIKDQYSAGTPVTVWYALATEEHETATMPTITTAKGQNTISIGTTLSPSSTEVTYLGIKNTYKEGWEIRDQQDRLIWGKNNTLTGVSSISFRGYGVPLKSIKIVGNTQQTGTPAPDAPIMPEFVGEKTGNLFDERIESAIISSGGVIESNVAYDVAVIPVIACEQYTFAYKQDYSQNYVIAYYTTKPVVGSTSYDSSRIVYNYKDTPKVTITVPNGVTYIAIRLPSNGDLMFNLGSTPLPYEPYGYKIPITCAGQTTPVYLGEVQTTRKIKKLVLDGQETNWIYEGEYERFGIPVYDMFVRGTRLVTLICSHYQCIDDGRTIGNVPNNSIYVVGGLTNMTFIKTNSYTTVDAFKNYLQEQYTNGTPVTIWYVLAMPETAIVNEPLAKIGSYADELIIDPNITPQTGTNILTVDTTLSPSLLSITGHIKETV